MKEIKIGTCGFRINKHKYADQLTCVEIQHTFYQPPQIQTLRRWREELPGDFEFTVKAWQLITHAATSPTYRRLRMDLTEQQKNEAGWFRWNRTVKNAWATMLKCVEALNAQTILFQCPASFKPTGENLKNLEAFFTRVDRN